MRNWLIGLLSLASCTQLVEFTKTLPPEITLPQGEQKILFLSRYDTSLIQYEDTMDIRALKNAYTALVVGLADGFKEIDHIELTPCDTLSQGHGFRYTDAVAFTDSLQLRNLQRQYPQHYLLTLDLLNLELIPFEPSYDGYDYKTWSYDMVAEAAFSLHDPQGVVVDQIFLDGVDEVKYRHSNSYVRVHPTIKEFTEKASFLSRDLGKNYAELFIEVPATVTRSYYNGKELNEAANLMAQKQWEPARELLLPLTEHDNPRVAAKAALNLSVVYEALGDHKASDHWLQKGQAGL